MKKNYPKYFLHGCLEGAEEWTCFNFWFIFSFLYYLTKICNSKHTITDYKEEEDKEEEDVLHIIQITMVRVHLNSENPFRCFLKKIKKFRKIHRKALVSLLDKMYFSFFSLQVVRNVLERLFYRRPWDNWFCQLLEISDSFIAKIQNKRVFTFSDTVIG